MARDNLWDALFGEIGRAVADVREKAVIEPWFGQGAETRPVSAMHRSVAEELGWIRGDADREHDSEHDVGILKEMGHDVDR